MSASLAPLSDLYKLLRIFQIKLNLWREKRRERCSQLITYTILQFSISQWWNMFFFSFHVKNKFFYCQKVLRAETEEIARWHPSSRQGTSSLFRKDISILLINTFCQIQLNNLQIVETAMFSIAWNWCTWILAFIWILELVIKTLANYTCQLLILYQYPFMALKDIVMMMKAWKRCCGWSSIGGYQPIFPITAGITPIPLTPALSATTSVRICKRFREPKKYYLADFSR